MDKKTGNRSPRSLNRLTDAKVRTLNKKGYVCDGGGLYLQVQIGTSGKARKSWIFRYRMHDKLRDMGLGSYIDVTLAEAREKAAACRKQLLEGIDPRNQRAEMRMSELELDEWTFERCAMTYHQENQQEWKNQKHAAQWISTLKTYVFPKIGHLPIRIIDTQHVIACLEPIWRTKSETAHRVKGRMRTILDWAAGKKYREDRNPVDSPALKQVLKGSRKLRESTPHESLPHGQIAEFVSKLRTLGTDSALGLEFLILTASRSGMVTGAVWEEIDLEEKVWTIPAARMKAEVEHWVTLSKPAIRILEKICPNVSERTGPIFKYRKRPLSEAAFKSVMNRLEYRGPVPHGMRATFRTWGGDMTSFEREALEHALAHGLPKDETELAYWRGTMINKRRPLMEVWGMYCDGKTIPQEFRFTGHDFEPPED